MNLELHDLTHNALSSDQNVALIPRQEAPYNAEFPIHQWWSWITPAPLFYVRSHFPVPELDPNTWRLALEGNGERSLSLSLTDLQQLPRHRCTALLECAGNRRTEFEPCPPGVPWRDGAVSSAVWEGVRLADVLALAGPLDTTREVVLEGADQGIVAGGTTPIPFARSLTLERALHPDALLVDQMNGSALSPAHGAPVRVLVPGAYGMDSVKWLVRIALVASPFEGHFQKNDYRLFPPPESPARAIDIGPVRVNSLIAWPPEGAELPFGQPVRVVGYAWSGSQPIQRVEISLNGGANWEVAELTGPEAPYAWRLWRFDWQPAASGAYVVASRAVDCTGTGQPEQVAWNVKGYANNSIRPVHVRVG